MRCLFVCSLGLCRSAMAAAVFSHRGVQARYGGLSPDAVTPVQGDDFCWADHVIVFESEHVPLVEARLRAVGVNVPCTCLPIADLFGPGCPALRAIIETQAAAGELRLVA